MTVFSRLFFLSFLLSFIFALPLSAAITVTPDQSGDNLAAAVTASGGIGITVTDAILSSNVNASGMSSGLYNLTGPLPDTYNLTANGIILSSGDVSDYATGPNTSTEFATFYGVAATPGQEALLDPITGGTFTHFDVTQLDIFFDVSPTTSNVFFQVVFGSEEFPEFVGSDFVDGFGLYLNGTNIAFVGGQPVNINHPDMAAIAGTELDGILTPNGNPVLLFSAPVTPGSSGNTLTFIVADTSDADLDTTVYISALGGTLPPPPPVASTLSINDVDVQEGNTAFFTVSLSPASNSPVSVEYETDDGSASARTDYQAKSGSLTFPAGTTRRTIRVNTTSDNLREGDEDFFLELFNASGASISDPRGKGRILDQVLPDIQIGNASLDYGQINVGTFKDAVLNISNTGSGTLFVSAVSNPLILVRPQTLRIQPGSSGQLTIRLIAGNVGPINTTLVLLTNDPRQPRVSIAIRGTGVAGPLGFTDISQSSGIANNNVRTTGMQWIDFDADNKQDLFLVGSNATALFKNVGNGKFRNVTGDANLENSGGDARGASWADVDNDGDPDLFIANANLPPAVLRNNDGIFQNVTTRAEFFASGAATEAVAGVWLDFNNDSLIDLYVVRDRAPNQLFKNLGGFRFSDVAASARVNFSGPGRSALAVDVNNDGFQDLYVVNFNRPNKLFINNGDETFRDATRSSQAGFSGASVQALAADYDNDEDFDIFIINSSGSSRLLRNLGNIRFQNVTGSAGLSGPKNATAGAFSDFDIDGDEDLILVQAIGGNLLFLNNSDGSFARAGNVDFSNPDNPSSVAIGDFDNDGIPDLSIGDADDTQENGDSLYEGVGGDGKNWIVLTLVGTVSNRSAIGAKVLVRTGLTFQAKAVTAGNGQNQESLPLEFGLDDATSVDTIAIEWPSGIEQTLTDVDVNQRLRITEPSQ